jgi:hypothetical protein
LTLKLVASQAQAQDSPSQGVQGYEWKCPGCGCKILRGHIAGARVRKGELNLEADSCHPSEQLKCQACDKLAAIKIDGRWKTLT